MIEPVPNFPSIVLLWKRKSVLSTGPGPGVRHGQSESVDHDRDLLAGTLRYYDITLWQLSYDIIVLTMIS